MLDGEEPGEKVALSRMRNRGVDSGSNNHKLYKNFYYQNLRYACKSVAQVNGKWGLGIGAEVERPPLARVDRLSHQVGRWVVAQSGLFYWSRRRQQ